MVNKSVKYRWTFKYFVMNMLNIYISCASIRPADHIFRMLFYSSVPIKCPVWVFDMYTFNLVKLGIYDRIMSWKYVELMNRISGSAYFVITPFYLYSIQISYLLCIFLWHIKQTTISSWVTWKKRIFVNHCNIKSKCVHLTVFIPCHTVLDIFEAVPGWLG